MIADIFSHLCGQGRCFIVDGQPLPVCQRCLGLYAGAAITMAWLLGRGLWRRSLRADGPLMMQGLALGLAVLGGIHLIDTGPAWRLACGLWTGHVAVVWLVGSARSLLTGSPGNERAVELCVAPVALAAFAVSISLYPIIPAGGRCFWTTVSCVGAGALALSLITAAAAVVCWIVPPMSSPAK